MVYVSLLSAEPFWRFFTSKGIFREKVGELEFLLMSAKKVNSRIHDVISDLITNPP